MLYVRLAIRNLKRSLKEYGIFVITLILTVMLMYAFNTCALSSTIQDFSARMEDFKNVIIGVTIFIVILMSWVVSYISKFIIRKRSREFGMYMLLGMKRSQITNMFLCEQITIGLLAFVVGCVAGQGLAQILNYILIRIFATPIEINLVFSSTALLYTFGYVVLMYALEIIREWFYLKRIKIQELLTADKRNEKSLPGNLKSLLACMITIILFAIGFHHLNTFANTPQATESSTYMMMGILYLILSSYSLYYILSNLLHAVLNGFHKIKYHKNLMFFNGEIKGKLRTNRFVLATLTTLTALSLIFITIGLLAKEITNTAINDYVSYDVYTVNWKEKVNTSAIDKYLKEHQIAYDKHVYEQYSFKDSKISIMEALKGSQYYFPDDPSYFIKESDYTKLRILKGYKAIPKLKNNEYGVSVLSTFEDVLKKQAKKSDVMVQGKQFSNGFVNSEQVGQGMHSSYLIILPDSFMNTAISKDVQNNQIGYIAAYETKDPTTVEMAEKVTMPFFEDNNDGNGSYLRIESKWIQENMDSYVIMTFLFFYIATIFICISAAILAIQQLSDLDKQKVKYQLLKNMGMTQRECNRLLGKQILLYFLLPIIISLFYVLPTLFILKIAFVELTSLSEMLLYFFYGFALFIILYGIYYFMTYYMSKKNITSN